MRRTSYGQPALYQLGHGPDPKAREAQEGGMMPGHVQRGRVSSVSAAVVQRNPVSSSHMVAAASLNDDGVARLNGLVQAPRTPAKSPGRLWPAVTPGSGPKDRMNQ